RASVGLALQASGTIVKTTKADAKGRFQLTFTAGFGMTPVRVSATAKGKKPASTTLTVNRPDRLPPSLVVQPFTPLTPTEETFTGSVSDVGTGVAALMAVVDASPAVSVSFNAAGNFSYTTTLPSNGSADGPHTVQFVATDRAGNQ